MSRLEHLLEPISDDRPGGEDIRYGDDFAELTAFRDLREKGRDRKWTPDWDGVADVAERILSEQSKDLGVALYLCEALLRKDGFSAFHEGLDLVLELLKRFPDDLHPVEPEDRAYALDFLVGALQADSRKVPDVILWVQLAPLTDWGHRLHDYQAWKSEKGGDKSKSKAKDKDAKDGADGDDEATPENFGKAFVETGKEYYKELNAALPKCIEAVAALEAWGKAYFDGKIDPKETPLPRYTRLTTELQNVHAAVADLLAKKLIDHPDPVVSSTPSRPVESEAAPGPTRTEQRASASETGIPPEPRDVEDATARVVVAARFLRRSAPTDPAPYMLLRGLRWGELRAGAGLDQRLLEPPDTVLRRQLTGLLVDQSWEGLLDACEEVMGMTCGRGWLDLQRYAVTALDNLGPEYRRVSEAIRGQLAALLADVPELLEYTMMDDLPTANAQTRTWLEAMGIVPAPAAESGDRPEAAPDYDRERALSEATHERALALAASGNARRGVEMLMKRAEREESARAKFITESLAASVMVDAGMAAVARPILEDLERTIEARKLAEWEAAEVVARPLGLLYRCLPPNERKRSDLYDKICRLDPVHAMSLDPDAEPGPASAGKPSHHDPSARGQPFKPNEPKKSSQQGEAVDSGSVDSGQGVASSS